MTALTQDQLAFYQQQGYLAAIDILTPSQASDYRDQLDKSCKLLNQLANVGADCQISRLDAMHQYFDWAWQLAKEPKIIAVMQQILGNDLLLKATRFFYKHPHSDCFVGWHQDGFTEKQTAVEVPTVWLGLTDSCAANGCLQVIKASHKLGVVPHPKIADNDNLTYKGTTAQIAIKQPINIEMNAGQMSMHHPLTVHGSKPNQSAKARIGFSASYTSAKLKTSISPVAWITGSEQAKQSLSPELQLIKAPKTISLAQAAQLYYQNLAHRIRWQHQPVVAEL